MRAIRLACAAAALSRGAAVAPSLPPDASYRRLPTQPFDAVRAADESQKAAVMQRQRTLLDERYDLSDRPIPGVKMSGGRKAAQGGVRIKLPAGATWDSLAALAPDEIRRRNLLPQGFRPLPHVKQATGGQVIPKPQIDEIARQEGRNLQRFDVDFDLPELFTRNSRRQSS